MNRIEYIEDVHGRPGFRITVEDPGEYRDVVFRANVDAVTAWDLDGDPADHEPYLHCTIKWDSCSHFRFGEPQGEHGDRDGYLHLCGVDGLKDHALLLEALYRIAFREMGREPEDGETW